MKQWEKRTAPAYDDYVGRMMSSVFLRLLCWFCTSHSQAFISISFINSQWQVFFFSFSDSNGERRKRTSSVCSNESLNGGGITLTPRRISWRQKIFLRVASPMKKSPSAMQLQGLCAFGEDGLRILILLPCLRAAVAALFLKMRTFATKCISELQYLGWLAWCIVGKLEINVVTFPTSCYFTKLCMAPLLPPQRPLEPNWPVNRSRKCHVTSPLCS